MVENCLKQNKRWKRSFLLKTMEKINFVTFFVLKTTAWSSCASSVALFNNFTCIFLCRLTTIWSVSLSLLCRGYRWVSQYNSNNRKIRGGGGTMWRGKRHESRFLPFPFPWSPARFIFSFSPASLRHKEDSAEGRANIWLFLYASKHCVPPFYTNTSLSLSFWVISLCIRSLLGFEKPGTHASALFVVKQQKSGECKLATSGTATFPRSSWPSRSPWMGWGYKHSY